MISAYFNVQVSSVVLVNLQRKTWTLPSPPRQSPAPGISEADEADEDDDEDDDDSDDDDIQQPRGSVRLMRMMRTDTSPDADHNDLNNLRDIEQPRGSLKLMTTDDNDHAGDNTLETGYDSKVRRVA